MMFNIQLVSFICMIYVTSIISDDTFIYLFDCEMHTRIAMLNICYWIHFQLFQWNFYMFNNAWHITYFDSIISTNLYIVLNQLYSRLLQICT